MFAAVETHSLRTPISGCSAAHVSMSDASASRQGGPAGVGVSSAPQSAAVVSEKLKAMMAFCSSLRTRASSVFCEAASPTMPTALPLPPTTSAPLPLPPLTMATVSGTRRPIAPHTSSPAAASPLKRVASCPQSVIADVRSAASPPDSSSSTTRGTCSSAGAPTASTRRWRSAATRAHAARAPHPPHSPPPSRRVARAASPSAPTSGAATAGRAASSFFGKPLDSAATHTQSLVTAAAAADAAGSAKIAPPSSIPASPPARRLTTALVCDACACSGTASRPSMLPTASKTYSLSSGAFRTVAPTGAALPAASAAGASRSPTAFTASSRCGRSSPPLLKTLTNRQKR
mmetsp:Transcript_9997/g.41432  ORF Transcript_9997/g.41432 Transcript_9997/m.41432 type:complete len:346 (-) Transcript_9997:224-1261(-)